MGDDVFDFLKDLRSASGGGSSSEAMKSYFPPDCTRCQWPSFYDITSLLNAGTLEIQVVLEALTDITIKLTGATRGFLLLVDENNQLEARVARDTDQKTLGEEEFRFSNSIVQEALRTRKAQHYSNLISDGGISETESIVDLEIFSAMCIPLAIRGGDMIPGVERRKYFFQPLPNTLGVLYVDSKDVARQFKPEDLTFFEALSNIITTAVVNAKLYQQATTDPLSRLYSRGQFEFLITEGVRKAKETSRPFSLIMLDLDHFKDVNDEHGHRAGDEVIRTVGDILKQNVRALDLCCRYGGEEFAILFADTDVEGVETIAQKLAEAFRETTCPGDLRVTASFGIAGIPDHADTADGLVAAADQALYRAKADGRDRVCVWSPELASERRQDALAGIFSANFSNAYQNIALLIEFVNVLNSPEGAKDLSSLALRKMIEATEAEWGALLLTGAGGYEVKVAYDRRMNKIKDPEINKVVVDEVLKARKSTLIPGQTPDGRQISLCAIPLVADGEAIGAIYLEAETAIGGIQQGLLPFFETLARQVALSQRAVREKTGKLKAKKKAGSKGAAKPKTKAAAKTKARPKPKAKKATRKKASAKSKGRSKKK
ncbi:MAG: diguanylate cyclase [Planctomycetota bacterium]|nr:MAG: diguanylate cyclase [Planctomycetota bacterium]